MKLVCALLLVLPATAIQLSRRVALRTASAAAAGVVLLPPVALVWAAAEDPAIIVDDVTVGGGDGPPKPDDLVSIDYTVWLDGFEKTFIAKEKGPLVVPLGGDKIIPGIRDALLGMRVGGTRRVVIPPELGFGATGLPKSGDKAGSIVPPNASLYVEVRLRTIKLSKGVMGLNLIP
ncbi:hypothetical protein M885DRAFT_504546 [Pelagophyceae sp. CCMP2097]|nr:hypothetical protein M885DRAFT_504546 [Pelagophyceae sp. CCMP2097]